MKKLPSFVIYIIGAVLLFFAIMGVRALLTEPEIIVDQSVKEKVNTEAIVAEVLKEVSEQDPQTNKPVNFILESNVNESKEGIQWFYQLNFQKAREHLEKSESSDLVARFYLAMIYSYEDKHEDAKNLFKSIVNDNSDMRLTQFSKEVLSAYNTFLLYRDSTTDFLYALLGKSYINVGQVTLGIVKLKQSLALNSQYADAWILLASSFIITKNYDEAEKALSQVPGDRPELSYYLGLSEKEQGKYQDAILSFQRALENGFKPIEQVYVELGDSYYGLGRNDTALTYYLDALSKTPQELEYYRKALWMHIEVFKNLDTALGLAQQMLEKNIKSPEAHAYVAWVAMEKDDVDLAKKYIDSGFTLSQESAALYYYRGMYEQKIGQTSQAEKDFQKAKELDTKGIFQGTEN